MTRSNEPCYHYTLFSNKKSSYISRLKKQLKFVIIRQAWFVSRGHLFPFCMTKKEVIVMNREDLFFWISIVSLIIQILEFIITISNGRDPNTVIINFLIN